MFGLLSLFARDPSFALYFALFILIGITIHEAAHSWTAKSLGDPTPELAGRVNLNPLRHLDPIGTLAIFLVGFGWGRPAPFNPSYFRHYKRDTALVAVAGPLSNLGLVMVAVILSQVLGLLGSGTLLATVLLAAIASNLILAVFNLIPIPPLDGSKILYALLPARYDDAFHRLEQIGPLFILAIFLFGAGYLTALYQPILEAVLRLAT